MPEGRDSRGGEHQTSELAVLLWVIAGFLAALDLVLVFAQLMLDG
jgi:hypothetical protein